MKAMNKICQIVFIRIYTTYSVKDIERESKVSRKKKEKKSKNHFDRPIGIPVIRTYPYVHVRV